MVKGISFALPFETTLSISVEVPVGVPGLPVGPVPFPPQLMNIPASNSQTKVPMAGILASK
jgi:hypothetical protein